MTVVIRNLAYGISQDVQSTNVIRLIHLSVPIVPELTDNSTPISVN
jgi:hypothetical protein